jgi:hypothetical protein
VCLAVGWGAAAALGLLWGVGSALRRAGQPLAGPKVDGQRLAKESCLPTRMGEGPFGDSDASVEACRDRHAPKGTGRGLLEAKLLSCLWSLTYLWRKSEVRGVRAPRVRKIHGELANPNTPPENTTSYIDKI